MNDEEVLTVGRLREILSSLELPDDTPVDLDLRAYPLGRPGIPVEVFSFSCCEVDSEGVIVRRLLTLHLRRKDWLEQKGDDPGDPPKSTPST